MIYDRFIERNIIANNDFGISEVHDPISLKYISFVKEEYKLIELLIEKGDFEAIKSFREDQPRTGEYLDVVFFKDQSQNIYIVTVYDSDALEQDPQTIKIYPIT